MSSNSEGFLNSTPGKIVVAVALLLSFSLAGYMSWRFFRGSDAVIQANDRVYVCSETGKSFHVNLANLIGKEIPIYSPFSGKNTGYPAELCYWTADGQTKTDPTPVLLNESVGKSGPTFCPDCGRLVVGHNPMPAANVKPPLTRAEWDQRHQQQPVVRSQQDRSSR
jgi:hypothetical protein